MANEYYAPGKARAEKVQDLFARIAPRYDLINDLQSFGLHRLWKRRLVRLANITPGANALDLCCGTGDIAFALAAKGAETVGLDFSREMLAIAEARRSSKSPGDPQSQVRFMQGDAQRLPFGASHFHAATIGYGLRNLTDWRTGLSEMHRVVRPGGRVLVLDFGKPDNRLWRAIYYGYLRFFVPVLGLAVARNAKAYAYILESLHHYPAQHGVESLMQELGMKDVHIHNFLGGAMTINVGVK